MIIVFFFFVILISRFDWVKNKTRNNACLKSINKQRQMLKLWWPNQTCYQIKFRVPIFRAWTIHNSSNFGMKPERGMEFPKVHSSSRGVESSEKGEAFGVILSRSRSVSNASTVALRAEKQSSALETAVKRALSMRRSRSSSSSCVSKGRRGGYYKIFHYLDDPHPFALTECHNVAIQPRKNKKSASRILDACKRLIGF